MHVHDSACSVRKVSVHKTLINLRTSEAPRGTMQRQGATSCTKSLLCVSAFVVFLVAANVVLNRNHTIEETLQEIVTWFEDTFLATAPQEDVSTSLDPVTSTSPDTLVSTVPDATNTEVPEVPNTKVPGAINTEVPDATNTEGSEAPHEPSALKQESIENNTVVKTFKTSVIFALPRLIIPRSRMLSNAEKTSSSIRVHAPELLLQRGEFLARILSRIRPDFEQTSGNKPVVRLLSRIRPDFERAAASEPSVRILSRFRPGFQQATAREPLVNILNRFRPAFERAAASKGPPASQLRQQGPIARHCCQCCSVHGRNHNHGHSSLKHSCRNGRKPHHVRVLACNQPPHASTRQAVVRRNSCSKAVCCNKPRRPQQAGYRRHHCACKPRRKQHQAKSTSTSHHKLVIRWMRPHGCHHNEQQRKYIS